MDAEFSDHFFNVREHGEKRHGGLVFGQAFDVVGAIVLILPSEGGRQNHRMGGLPVSNPFAQGGVGCVEATDAGNDLGIQILENIHIPDARAINGRIAACQNGNGLTFLNTVLIILEIR